MHFDEDNAYDNAPEQGDALALETAGGEVDLGPATYDLDNDGVADSVIVVEGNNTYLATDSDGDGYIDQVIEDPANSDLPGGEPTDPEPSDPRSGGSTEFAPGSALDTLEEEPDPEPTNQTVDNPTGGDDVMIIENDGKTTELGEPTLDSDGDGTADTFVTKLDDGSVITFTDLDGDGDADQITAIGVDGSLEIAAPDGRGGWEPVARGHITADGDVVIEEV